MKTLARAADRDALIARVRLVRPDSQRRWGRLTAPEMVCHVADLFEIALGERETAPVTTVLWRRVVKWIALYLPTRWPKGFPTIAQAHPRRAGTTPTDFAADMARLEALYHRFSGPAARVARPPHPLFGDLSGREWRRWGYLHLDHHLRQFGL